MQVLAPATHDVKVSTDPLPLPQERKNGLLLLRRMVLRMALNSTDPANHGSVPVFYDEAQMCITGSPGIGRVQFGITTMLCVVLAVVFATITYWKYNYVLVIHRFVHTSTISNTPWISFFIVAAMQYIIRLVRIVAGSPRGTLDVGLFYSQLFAQGSMTLLLCIAMDYQRRYRSSAPPMLPAGFVLPRGREAIPQETKSLLNISGDIDGGSLAKAAGKKGGLRTIASLAMAYYIVMIAVIIIGEQPHDNSRTDLILKWGFRSVIWSMQLAVLVLGALIVCNDDEDGPSKRSKVLLSIATVVYVTCHVLPNGDWQHTLPKGCVYLCFGWTDILDLLIVISLILLFLFMRGEFLRNKETCIYSTVSRIQHAHINKSWTVGRTGVQ